MAGQEFLDNLIVYSRVGFGELGRRGNLGYEGKQVDIDGHACDRSLSTHPPARVICRLDREYQRFRAGAAINRDVAGSISADFTVLGDGRPLARARNVTAGDPVQMLTADTRGVESLELVVSTTRWRECHAVWLNPVVEACETQSAPSRSRVVDCLERTEIEVPTAPARAKRCIATIASRGFERFLDGMLSSLRDFGECGEALRVVLLVDDAAECREIALRYGAVPVNCRSIAGSRVPSIKAALYSLALVIDADEYLCLDADTVILGSLRPLFELMSGCTTDRILVCREGNLPLYRNLANAFSAVYRGTPEELQSLLGPVADEPHYPLVVNDGVFGGSAQALRALDRTIRSFTGAVQWVNSRPDVGWRNQFLFNLALAKLDCALELRPTFNVQLHAQKIDIPHNDERPRLWKREPIRVLHFSGKGKRFYSQWYARYCSGSLDSDACPSS